MSRVARPGYDSARRSCLRRSRAAFGPAGRHPSLSLRLQAASASLRSSAFSARNRNHGRRPSLVGGHGRPRRGASVNPGELDRRRPAPRFLPVPVTLDYTKRLRRLGRANSYSIPERHRTGARGCRERGGGCVTRLLGRGQAVRRGTLDPVFEGSNPSAPTTYRFDSVESTRSVGMRAPESRSGSATHEPQVQAWTDVRTLVDADRLW